MNNQNIQAVFFDVGATLLTPAVDEGATFAEIGLQFGLKIDPAEVSKLVPTMYSLYEQLYEQDDSFWSDNIRARAIWIEMYEYLASLLGIAPNLHRELANAVYLYYFSPGSWQAYDDVLPTLDALRERGLRLGLISNWDSSLVPIIEGIGLGAYFETVVASAVVQLHKPMPEIFQLALNRLDITAAEAMHVGDHKIADAQGAADVGILPVLLDRNNRHTNYQGLRVQKLTELLDLI